jgi:MFS family permease
MGVKRAIVVEAQQQDEQSADAGPWYAGVTRYQWIVLVIASLGWVFDVFEGQIFVASMNEATTSLLPAHVAALPEAERSGYKRFYDNVTLAAFLLGGAIGGVVFGIVGDRIGRKKAMTYTIVMYSAFTCLAAFSMAWWHMAVFRFFVAMGVGGEWAVASALVAEVFPKRARAWSGGIFHASSVLGTLLAVAVGTFVIANPKLHFADYPTLSWRIGFLVGVLPSLLIIWVRMSLKEPESWQRAKTSALGELGEKLGSFGELFEPRFRRRTLVGLGLAAVGLATFWGVHIYGKDLLKYAAQAQVEAEGGPNVKERLKNWEMLGMFLTTIGGGTGLVLFGPICERFGRRRAFLFYHVGGLAAALAAFLTLSSTATIVAALPVFGFLTLGMHAGYAIYFPELYPTRLRGTGGGFCFNCGRIIAAPVLLLSGWLQRPTSAGGVGLSLNASVTCLSLLYLVGCLLLLFAPETKGRELPE